MLLLLLILQRPRFLHSACQLYARQCIRQMLDLTLLILVIYSCSICVSDMALVWKSEDTRVLPHLSFLFESHNVSQFSWPMSQRFQCLPLPFPVGVQGSLILKLLHLAFMQVLAIKLLEQLLQWMSHFPLLVFITFKECVFLGHFNFNEHMCVGFAWT